MTLGTKIYKFKRAVWEYRGRYNPATKIWSVRPQPKAKSRVIKGLERLGVNVGQGMQIINSLNSKPEFDAWVSEIRREREQPQIGEGK